MNEQARMVLDDHRAYRSSVIDAIRNLPPAILPRPIISDEAVDALAAIELVTRTRSSVLNSRPLAYAVVASRWLGRAAYHLQNSLNDYMKGVGLVVEDGK